MIRPVIFGGISEVHPVRPKGFDGMLGALFAIAAAQIIGRAVPIAAPADALRMCGVYGYPSCHLWREFSVVRPLPPNWPAAILLQ
jgi:hypothetical protein